MYSTHVYTEPPRLHSTTTTPLVAHHLHTRETDRRGTPRTRCDGIETSTAAHRINHRALPKSGDWCVMDEPLTSSSHGRAALTTHTRKHTATVSKADASSQHTDMMVYAMVVCCAFAVFVRVFVPRDERAPTLFWWHNVATDLTVTCASLCSVLRLD